MANTQNYLSHLLQATGFTPACSEEEREAAEDIAGIFSDHGFEPEIQEFTARGTAKVVQAVLGIVVFIGSLLMGVGGVVGIVGVVLLVAAAVVYMLERMGRPVFSQLGAGGLSQNVIAYHKASGPLASPRNRPVVVVAHYDSPREDFMYKAPFSKYRPVMVKCLPYCMVAPAILGVIKLFPFPNSVKTLIWIIAIVVAVIPLIDAVAIIANRFVLPYTTGAVCNKSSVAAMLGVMDEVSPYAGEGDEFADDVPADEYFAEQQRIHEEELAALEAERLAKEAEKAAKKGGSAETPEEESLEEGYENEEPLDETFEAAPLSDEDAGLADLDEPDLDEPFDFEGNDGSVAAGEAPGEDVMSGDADGAAETETPAVEEAEGEELEPASEELVDESEPDAVPADETIEIDADDLAGDFNETLEMGLEEGAEPEPEPEPLSYPYVNEEGNVRFGPDIVRSLGMLPEACVLVYPEDMEPEEDDEDVAETEIEEAEEQPVEGFRTIRGHSYASQSERYGRRRESEPEGEPEQFYEEGPESLDEVGAAQAPEPIEFEEERPRKKRWTEWFAKKRAGHGKSANPEPEEAPDEEQAEDDAAPVEPLDETMAAPVIGASSDDSSENASADAVDVAASTTVAVGSDSSDNVISFPKNQEQEEASRAEADGGAQDEQPVETVDSIMAQINAHNAPKRNLNIPSTTDVPLTRTPNAANRATLLDLPDPTDEPNDPFASPYESQSSSKKKSSASSASASSTSWKGGAVSSEDVSEDELRESITSMGDDELLGHDIWFVATGASEDGHAGINAFLDEHRDMLRGVFLINLECVGAGQVVMVTTEGERRVLKGDKRIMNLVSQVSEDFHNGYGIVEMSYESTDAYAAMSRSLRSLTLGGVDENGFACSHSSEDQAYNIDLENVAFVSDVVAEVIRRS